ncbi:MAG: RCC1 domain-containing protein [Gammaproteobacteria bacterium]|jgi:hypothetical protein
MFKIKKISIGYFHTLFLGTDGKVYYTAKSTEQFSNNHMPLLGFSKETLISRPIPIANLSKFNIIDVATVSHYGSLFLTDKNEIYIMGSLGTDYFNSEGSFGDQYIHECSNPELLKGISKKIKITNIKANNNFIVLQAKNTSMVFCDIKKNHKFVKVMFETESKICFKNPYNVIKTHNSMYFIEEINSHKTKVYQMIRFIQKGTVSFKELEQLSKYKIIDIVKYRNMTFFKTLRNGWIYLGKKSVIGPWDLKNFLELIEGKLYLKNIPNNQINVEYLFMDYFGKSIYIFSDKKFFALQKNKKLKKITYYSNNKNNKFPDQKIIKIAVYQNAYHMVGCNITNPPKIIVIYEDGSMYNFSCYKKHKIYMRKITNFIHEFSQKETILSRKKMLSLTKTKKLNDIIIRTSDKPIMTPKI